MSFFPKYRAQYSCLYWCFVLMYKKCLLKSVEVEFGDWEQQNYFWGRTRAAPGAECRTHPPRVEYLLHLFWQTKGVFSLRILRVIKVIFHKSDLFIKQAGGSYKYIISWEVSLFGYFWMAWGSKLPMLKAKVPLSYMFTVWYKRGVITLIHL